MIKIETIIKNNHKNNIEATFLDSDTYFKFQSYLINLGSMYYLGDDYLYYATPTGLSKVIRNKDQKQDIKSNNNTQP